MLLQKAVTGHGRGCHTIVRRDMCGSYASLWSLLKNWTILSTAFCVAHAPTVRAMSVMTVETIIILIWVDFTVVKRWDVQRREGRSAATDGLRSRRDNRHCARRVTLALSWGEAWLSGCRCCRSRRTWRTAALWKERYFACLILDSELLS